MIPQAAMEAAFRDACAEELAAPKPGNVHVHAAGHGMTIDHFLLSAEVAAPFLCRAGAPLGQRVLDAVRATRAAVGLNTNLGIILLGAPLVMAGGRSGADLQADLHDVLDEADVTDSQALFRAIEYAAPGGLGDAPEHDVRRPATVAPRVAMVAAAQRDSIARQWATDFADVFGCGMKAYAAALDRWPDRDWAPLGVYLWFLSAMPDSHVWRKCGAAEAERTRLEAMAMRARLAASTEPAAELPALLEWDGVLKARGVNPGTSADLTVATILAWRLRQLRGSENRINPIDC
jgi:triphosphoribosyl-dephospho-CoA synthase